MADGGRASMVPLIDLLPDQADAVRDAMNNVGIDVVIERIGVQSEEATLSRAVRLFVPRHQLRDARDVVRGVLPQYRRDPGTEPQGAATGENGSVEPADSDEQWSQIVADLRAEGVGEQAPPLASRPVPDPLDDERYVPPEPPPLPRMSKAAIASWVGLLGGIVLVVLGTLSGSRSPLVLIGVAVFVGGFVSLIARAAPHRKDSGHDDGAVL